MPFQVEIETIVVLLRLRPCLFTIDNINVVCFVYKLNVVVVAVDRGGGYSGKLLLPEPALVHNIRGSIKIKSITNTEGKLWTNSLVPLVHDDVPHSFIQKLISCHPTKRKNSVLQHPPQTIV